MQLCNYAINYYYFFFFFFFFFASQHPQSINSWQVLALLYGTYLGVSNHQMFIGSRVYCQSVLCLLEHMYVLMFIGASYVWWSILGSRHLGNLMYYLLFLVIHGLGKMLPNYHDTPNGPHNFIAHVFVRNSRLLLTAVLALRSLLCRELYTKMFSNLLLAPEWVNSF